MCDCKAQGAVRFPPFVLVEETGGFFDLKVLKYIYKMSKEAPHLDQPWTLLKLFPASSFKKKLANCLCYEFNWGIFKTYFVSDVIFNELLQFSSQLIYLLHSTFKIGYMDNLLLDIQHRITLSKVMVINLTSHQNTQLGNSFWWRKLLFVVVSSEHASSPNFILKFVQT